MKDIITNLYRESLELLKIIYDLSERNELLNSQEFLDWLDELNEISVKN